MKKKAIDLKVGEKMKIAEEFCAIEELDVSDIGKQGKRKVRIAGLNSKGERIVLIRPDDYPVETL